MDNEPKNTLSGAEAKVVVIAAWPDSTAGYLWNWRILSSPINSLGLRCLGIGATEDEAWIDAANKIMVTT